MLPASTGERKQRDVTKGRPDGRTVEIQRLIGRSLRGVIDFAALGERTIYVDCDVLQADGGTRCASITGGLVALRLACERLIAEGLLERTPLTGTVAAVSCGIVDGVPLLDLDYPEDSAAEVDANVVMTGEGGLVEVQATAERTPLSRAHLDELLALAAGGIEGLRTLQDDAVTAAAALSVSAGSVARPGTRNPHKVRELRALLAPRGVEVDRCPTDVELPPEDGRRSPTTRCPRPAAAAATGRAAIADDSGIEAAALGGAPGVRSARYAGEGATDEENLAKCVRRGAGRESAALRVRAGLRRSGGRRGAGVLRRVPRGGWPPSAAGSGGFGYDPVFVPDEHAGRSDDGRASTDAEKDAISHRGRRAASVAGVAADAESDAPAGAPRAQAAHARRCRWSPTPR